MTEADRIKAKRNAIAFKIWRYASEVEWNATIAEVAEAIGEPWQVVSGLCRARGWNSRLRSASPGMTEGNIRHGLARAAHHLTQDIIAGRVGLAE